MFDAAGWMVETPPGSFRPSHNGYECEHERVAFRDYDAMWDPSLFDVTLDWHETPERMRLSLVERDHRGRVLQCAQLIEEYKSYAKALRPVRAASWHGSDHPTADKGGDTAPAAGATICIGATA